MSCKYSQEFLVKHDIVTKNIQNAGKDRVDPKEALSFVKSAATLFSMKGKKIAKISLKKDQLSDKELLELMIGPSGYLRAPAMRFGKTMVVGFNAEQYEEIFL